MSTAGFVWSIDFGRMYGKIVDLRTREGFVRRAKLTEVRYYTLTINGIVIEVPDTILLDGDDEIPFAQIETMSVADEEEEDA